jgi:site-specific recombinase XerD
MQSQHKRQPRAEQPPRPVLRPVDTYQDCVQSWQLSLQAANRSPATQRMYLGVALDLHRYLLAAGRPTAPTSIRRQDLEAYLADQLARFKPNTAAAAHKSLRRFWAWMLEEGEIDEDPMTRIKAPHVPEPVTPILGAAALKALLATCTGRSFKERRDYALLCLLIDSGLRRHEAAGLKLEDVDLSLGICRVVGKGRRPRIVPFGAKTAAALDRYRRVRREHRAAGSTAWWLGHAGPMTDEGVYEIVKRRAEEAGLDVHPHQLRHQFAHASLAGGGQEGDLMRLAGWRSRTMLNRYGASAADERAREAYRTRSQVDGL